MVITTLQQIHNDAVRDAHLITNTATPNNERPIEGGSVHMVARGGQQELGYGLRLLMCGLLYVFFVSVGVVNAVLQDQRVRFLAIFPLVTASLAAGTITHGVAFSWTFLAVMAVFYRPVVNGFAALGIDSRSFAALLVAALNRASVLFFAPWYVLGWVAVLFYTPFLWAWNAIKNIRHQAWFNAGNLRFVWYLLIAFAGIVIVAMGLAAVVPTALTILMPILANELPRHANRDNVLQLLVFVLFDHPILSLATYLLILGGVGSMVKLSIKVLAFGTRAGCFVYILFHNFLIASDEHDRVQHSAADEFMNLRMERRVSTKYLYWFSWGVINYYFPFEEFIPFVLGAKFAISDGLLFGTLTVFVTFVALGFWFRWSDRIKVAMMACLYTLLVSTTADYCYFHRLQAAPIFIPSVVALHFVFTGIDYFLYSFVMTVDARIGLVDPNWYAGSLGKKSFARWCDIYFCWWFALIIGVYLLDKLCGWYAVHCNVYGGLPMCKMFPDKVDFYLLFF